MSIVKARQMGRSPKDPDAARRKAEERARKRNGQIQLRTAVNEQLLMQGLRDSGLIGQRPSRRVVNDLAGVLFDELMRGHNVT